MGYYIEERLVFKVIETETAVAVAVCTLQSEAEYIKKCLEEVEKETPKKKESIF